MALPSQNRLKRKKDFDSVFKEGKTLKGSCLFIKYKKNMMSVSRFGFVISLKIIGNVTSRNRIKRVLSEAVQLHIEKIKRGQDAVITVTKKEKEDIFKGEMLKLLGIQ